MTVLCALFKLEKIFCLSFLKTIQLHFLIASHAMKWLPPNRNKFVFVMNLFIMVAYNVSFVMTQPRRAVGRLQVARCISGLARDL